MWGPEIRCYPLRKGSPKPSAAGGRLERSRGYIMRLSDTNQELIWTCWDHPTMSSMKIAVHFTGWQRSVLRTRRSSPVYAYGR